MKNFKLKRLLSLALIGSLGSLGASTAYAAAGDSIINTATINFTVGGGPEISVDSNPTEFVEDNLVNFTVLTFDPLGGVPTSPSATDAYLTFTVTNNGNGAQDFNLSAFNLADDFDPTSFAIFVDSGNGGGYDPADTAVYIDELAGNGGVATVYIVSLIPDVTLPLVDGNIAAMTLVAEVRAGDAAGVAGDPTDILTMGGPLNKDNTVADIVLTEQNVFNDGTGDDVTLGNADVDQNGLHSDTSQYLVTAARISVLKEQLVIWDPVNGSSVTNDPKAIPGAYVQYTLTITNAVAAGASATLTTLTDVLSDGTNPLAPGILAFDPDLLDGTGVPPSVGAATIAADTSFSITHGAIAPVINGRTAVSASSCTGITVPGDGCNIVGQDITLTFSTLMPIDGAYFTGELKPGETVTIVFNAIIQ